MSEVSEEIPLILTYRWIDPGKEVTITSNAATYFEDLGIKRDKALAFIMGDETLPVASVDAVGLVTPHLVSWKYQCEYEPFYQSLLSTSTKVTEELKTVNVQLTLYQIDQANARITLNEKRQAVLNGLVKTFENRKEILEEFLTKLHTTAQSHCMSYCTNVAEKDNKKAPTFDSWKEPWILGALGHIKTEQARTILNVQHILDLISDIAPPPEVKAWKSMIFYLKGKNSTRLFMGDEAALRNRELIEKDERAPSNWHDLTLQDIILHFWRTPDRDYEDLLRKASLEDNHGDEPLMTIEQFFRPGKQFDWVDESESLFSSEGVKEKDGSDPEDGGAASKSEYADGDPSLD